MPRQSTARKKTRSKVLKKLVEKCEKYLFIARKNEELQKEVKKIKSDRETLDHKAARQEVRIAKLKLQLAFKGATDDQDASSANNEGVVLGTRACGQEEVVERGMMLALKTAQKKTHSEVLKELIEKCKRYSMIARKNKELQKEVKKLKSDREKLDHKAARQGVRIAGLILELKFMDATDDRHASSANDEFVVLGTGGHGQVFEVVERDRRFALKKPLKASSTKALWEELKMLSICKKKGIENMVPFFQYNGKYGPGIGMVKLPHTLAHEIKQGRVDYKRFLSIATQMWEIVLSLHKEGIMHCDIKADNVLCHRQALFACDFGLASEIDQGGNSRSGDTFVPNGYGYWPPAVAMKDQIIGVGVDFWGIILILLEIIFGHQIPTQNYETDRPNYADLLKKKEFSGAWKTPEHLGGALKTLVEFVDSELNKSTPCNSPCFKKALRNFLTACKLGAK